MQYTDDCRRLRQKTQTESCWTDCLVVTCWSLQTKLFDNTQLNSDRSWSSLLTFFDIRLCTSAWVAGLQNCSSLGKYWLLAEVCLLILLTYFAISLVFKRVLKLKHSLQYRMSAFRLFCAVLHNKRRSPHAEALCWMVYMIIRLLLRTSPQHRCSPINLWPVCMMKGKWVFWGCDIGATGYGSPARLHPGNTGRSLEQIITNLLN